MCAGGFGGVVCMRVRSRVILPLFTALGAIFGFCRSHIVIPIVNRCRKTERRNAAADRRIVTSCVLQ